MSRPIESLAMMHTLRRGPYPWATGPLLAGVLAWGAACGPESMATGLAEPCDAPGTYVFEEAQTCYCTRAGEKLCVGRPSQEADDGGQVDFLTYNSNHMARLAFVVDASPGMARIQGKLARAMDVFVERLADYGMGVAATVISADAGTVGDACPTPEAPAGTPVYESCRMRLASFSDDAAAMSACTDVCDMDVLPEVEDPADGSTFPGVIAYPDGTGTPAPAAALACALPLGEAGCRFAQPVAALEAFRRNPPASFRGGEYPDAAVIVTDGSECSTRDPEIYDPQGMRTFFPDPNLSEANEAVCWNAGVACSGDPAGYDACVPVDLGPDGQPVAASDAVLEPVADPLPEHDDGAVFLFGAFSRLLLVAGYDPADPDGPLTLSSGTDPAFAAEHGIGPSCEAGEIRATPPVRLEAYGEHFRRIHRAEVVRGSVCAEGLEASMLDLADRLGRLRTFCHTVCPFDAEPGVPGIQPVCHFEAPVLGDVGPVTLPRCNDEAGAEGIPDGAPACVRTIFGEAAQEACGEEYPESMAVRIEVSSETIELAPMGLGVVVHCLSGRLEAGDVCDPQTMGMEDPQ